MTKLTILVPLTPVPASRPRVTRWGTYYGKRYKEWLSLAAEAVEQSSSGHMQVPCSVNALFAIPRSKASKLIVPVGDIDNYLKAILDVLQHVNILQDDKLVTSVVAKKRFLPHGTDGYTLISLTDELEEIDIEE